MAVGKIIWDVEREEWVADDSLRRRLELLTSDPQLRKGRLGKDLDRSRNIAMRVAAAWESVARDSTRNASLMIPKLDITETEGAMELFPSYRPLVDLVQPHG